MVGNNSNVCHFSRQVYLNRVPLCKSVAGSTVAVVVSVDALEPLHLLDNLHGILFDQCFVREDVLLLCAAVQVCARQDVGNCSKSGENTFNSFFMFPCVCVPVEQHGNELDDNDGEEEEHEDDSDGLKVQVLFGDNDLGKSKF